MPPTPTPIHIIYLYSEVMPYTIAVMRALVRQHGAIIDCVYWDERKRTPFAPQDEAGITFHKRSGFNQASLQQFISARKPAIIYIVGRMDPLYLRMAIQFKRTSHIVSGSDNQWSGRSVKQRIAVLFSRLLYRRYFKYIWVPGKRQYMFAQQMGYSPQYIINNLLTADDAVFGKAYGQHLPAKQARYPHNIVFAGRFAATKGVDILVAAFNEAKAETNNDWTLTLIGSGDMQLQSSKDITIKGFMSGEDLAADSVHWGVFCLPSRYEPWGVVVHEFTMAGLPMICSAAVGAADALVREDENGYIFKTGDKEALKATLQQIMAKTDEELLQMSARSHQLSAMQSPAIAAASLMNILDPVA